MEIVLLLVGLLCAAVGVQIFRAALVTSRSGERFDGEVIGYVASRGGKNGSVTFAPVVAFQHPRAGRCIAQHPISGGGFQYLIGERVRVLVSSTEPLCARIDTDGAFWFGGIFAVVGISCIALFFTIFRWTIGSVAFSLFILALIAWKLWRTKNTLPNATQVSNGIRSAAMSEVVPEASFDRTTLVPRSDIEEKIRRQPRQALVSGLIILTLGAGGVLWSYLWDAKRSAFLDRAVIADGTVVELARSSGTKGTTWAPIVEFTPRDASEAVRFRHSVVSSNPSWSVGDRVRVLYDPARPEDAMIDSGVWNRITPFIPGAVGALMIVGGFLAIRSSRRQTARLQALAGAGLA